MLQQKIQTMMHRDVDGVKVDGHTRRQSQSARQLHESGLGGSLSGSLSSTDSAHLTHLAQRRRAALTGAEDERTTRAPQMRRAASSLNFPPASASLLAATLLRRQQQQQQLLAREQAAAAAARDAGTEDVATPAASASATTVSVLPVPPVSSQRSVSPLPLASQVTPDPVLLDMTPHPIAPSPDPSTSLSSTGSSVAVTGADGEPVVVKRQLKMRPQIRSWRKMRDKPQNTEQSLLLLESRYKGGVFPEYIRRSRLERDLDDESDKEMDPRAATSDEESKAQLNKGSDSEANGKRKGDRFSQFPGKFRDLVAEKLQRLARTNSSKDTGTLSDQASSGASTPGGRSAGSGSEAQNGTAKTGSILRISSSDAADNDSKASPSPLAHLRDRERQLAELDRERQFATSEAWKPRPLPASLSEASAKGMPPPDNESSSESLRMHLNGKAINAKAAPSIADTLAAAAAAAAFSSEATAPTLSRAFTSPAKPLSASTASGVRDPRSDAVPLFLRKQSDRDHRLRPDALMLDSANGVASASSSGNGTSTPLKERERSSSNASLASPGGNVEAVTRWAQELAGLRQHMNQHSSNMEVQISDIESALTAADIGSIKARLDLLEDLQRNKKNDLESRIVRLEGELQNMKQVQRSNLKTIYDALSAQNISAVPSSQSVGVHGTLMDAVYVLITWFGLGIATISQPLGALLPYMAPLACCRRRNREEAAAPLPAATTATTGTDPFAIAVAQPPSTSTAQSFPPAALHHHADRDRYQPSGRTSGGSSKFDRLPAAATAPGAFRSRRNGGGGFYSHSRLPSSASNGDRESREDDDATTTSASTPALHRTPPSAAMSGASSAPISDDDDDDEDEDVTPRLHHAHAYHRGREGVSGSTTAAEDVDDLASTYDSDRDSGSMQSEVVPPLDAYASYTDDGGFLQSGASSRASSSLGGAIVRPPPRVMRPMPLATSSGTMGTNGANATNTTGHAPTRARSTLSTMAQLRNASKRLVEANRRA